ncbi:MAG: PEP-CTERM sorting domain-containing protein [Armatimonadetes bacterium]|nr:PEP-CTERM sorting domain-containing protein [Armatimonadota bacterium]
MMKRVMGFVAVCAFALTSGLHAQTLVTSGTYSGNGHQYYIYDAAGIDWASAQAFATSLGGYLATITDAGENAFVASLNSSVISDQRWLGGFQPQGETNPLANWQWVTGEAWGYTNWGPGEPNDAFGPGSEQHLAIGLYSPTSWNDEGDLSHIRGFVVEVPEPASMAALSIGLAGLLGLRRRRK